MFIKLIVRMSAQQKENYQHVRSNAEGAGRGRGGRTPRHSMARFIADRDKIIIVIYRAGARVAALFIRRLLRCLGNLQCIVGHVATPTHDRCGTRTLL